MRIEHVLIDIDGTLADFTESFVAAACVEAKAPEHPVLKSLCELRWEGCADVCKVLGIEAGPVWERVFSARSVRRMKTRRGAAAAIRRLVTTGHTIEYVTARPESCISETGTWLTDNCFPFGNVSCISPEGRVERALANPVATVLIDDCPGTIEYAVSKDQPVVVPLQVYNTRTIVDTGVPYFRAWESFLL